MEDVFLCCDHLDLGFVLLLGVGVDPVMVPSTLSDISPTLLVLNDDDSVIQKMKNNRICQS